MYLMRCFLAWGQNTFLLLLIFTIGQVGPVADLHVLHILKSNLKIRYDNRQDKAYYLIWDDAKFAD